jgi:lysophospholipase L1-like esterase
MFLRRIVMAGMVCGAVAQGATNLPDAAASAVLPDRVVRPFVPGDSVCFIGDSITQGGLYHANILLFYATRFPELWFEVHNAGISGDSATGAVRRAAWDILARKPTVAAIMFGMNDVERHFYGADKTDADSFRNRQAAMETHTNSMTSLAGMLSKTGCRLIFITPSIYDQTGLQATPNLFGVNDALAACGRFGRELAVRFDGGVVDFHSLMTSLNAEGQKKDPASTIIGPDRVHPGEAGHLVMAYAFLKAQGMSATVAEMSVDAASGEVARQINCTVSGVKPQADGLVFECLEKALPFPVPAGARKGKALELVPFTRDLNQERLIVSGLRPGRYEIRIDGTNVDTRTADELKAGINLADNAKTPQWQQAARVRDLNEQRRKLHAERLRLLAGVRHWVLEPAHPRPVGVEAEQKVLEAQRELDLSQKKPIYWYINYMRYKPDERAIEREAAELWDAVHAANRPVAHRFEVRRCADR